MKKLFYFAILFLLVSAGSLHAQFHESLVKIDPCNLKVKKIDSIPGMMYIVNNLTTYDEVHHRYIVVGTTPAYTPYTLYTIDAITGKILHQPLFATNFNGGTVSATTFRGLEYDAATDSTFILAFNSNTQQLALASVDLATGNIYPKAPLPTIYTMWGSTAFDKNHHRYFFCGGDYYVLDANTGAVLKNFPNNSALGMVRYSNTDDRLYGLNASANGDMLDTLDLNNGTVTNLFTIPNTGSMMMNPLILAMDQKSSRYFFVCMYASGQTHLMTVDMKGGAALCDPIDTILSPFGNGTNLCEFHYDNVLDTMFGLIWAKDSFFTPGVKDNIVELESNFQLHPNPVNDRLFVENFANGNNSASIYNAMGVLQMKDINLDKGSIDVSLLHDGMYFISIQTKTGMLNRQFSVLH